ncbi:MAG: hypothetical protein P1U63_13050 [Coxiellaceae bacterium]|nr:hypothetical protein [Coxiellaceae bacterium]
MKKIGMFLRSMVACTVFIAMASYASSDAGMLVNKFIPNGAVLNIVHDDANNALFVAGQFTGFGMKTGGGALFESNGSLNHHSPIFSGSVLTAIADGKGGFYVGGNFSQVNTAGIQYLAHLTQSGIIDAHFKPAIDGPVRHLAKVSTRLYVATDHRVYEVDLLSGKVLPAFSLSVDHFIYDMQADSHGVYIGGNFKHVNGVAWANFAKASRNTGVIDKGYYQTHTIVNKILSTPNDGLYISNYAAPLKIIKLHKSAGTIDLDFCGSSIVQVPLVVAADNDWLYVSIDSPPYIRRYDAKTGDIDSYFSVQVDKAPSTITFDNQYMYLTGSFAPIHSGSKRARIVRFDKLNFVRDENYHPQVSGKVITATHNNDRLFVGGEFNSAGREGPAYVAKINLATGMLDQHFNPVINRAVYALLLDHERLFVGGEFTAVNGQYADRIALLSPTSGELDQSFLPQANGAVYVLKKHRGYLFVGGKFSYIGGRKEDYLARFKLEDLSQDSRFAFGQDNTVWDVAFKGKHLYVGGDFTGHLNDYSLDTGIKLTKFKPIINGRVRRLLFDVDHVYATGDFPEVVVRLNPRTGRRRPKFKPNITGEGFSLAKHGGFIYVGTNRSLVRLDSVTAEQDMGFDPKPNSVVYHMLVDGDSLIVSGYFTRIAEKFEPYLSYVKLNGD